MSGDDTVGLAEVLERIKIQLNVLNEQLGEVRDQQAQQAAEMSLIRATAGSERDSKELLGEVREEIDSLRADVSRALASRSHFEYPMIMPRYQEPGRDQGALGREEVSHGTGLLRETGRPNRIDPGPPDRNG